MKFQSSIISLATLLTLTLSAPLTERTAISSTNPPTWTVTNYETGCSPAGCVYNFNITTNAYSTSPVTEPAFSTYCHGTNIQDKLVECADTTVSANEVNGWSNYTLVIQHKWNQELENGGGVATYWIVGNYTIVVDGSPAPTTFEVPQLEYYAIA